MHSLILSFVKNSNVWVEERIAHFFARIFTKLIAISNKWVKDIAVVLPLSDCCEADRSALTVLNHNKVKDIRKYVEIDIIWMWLMWGTRPLFMRRNQKLRVFVNISFTVVHNNAVALKQCLIAPNSPKQCQTINASPLRICSIDRIDSMIGCETSDYWETGPQMPIPKFISLWLPVLPDLLAV